MSQVSPELKAELVQKLINHELTVFDITAQYHITPTTAYLWLREQGQFFTDARLIMPEAYNLSGKARYVVAQCAGDDIEIVKRPSEQNAEPVQLAFPTLNLSSDELKAELGIAAPKQAEIEEMVVAVKPEPAAAAPKQEIAAEPKKEAASDIPEEEAEKSVAPSASTLLAKEPEVVSAPVAEHEDETVASSDTTAEGDSVAAAQVTVAASAAKAAAEPKVQTGTVSAALKAHADAAPSSDEDEDKADEWSGDDWAEVGNLDEMELDVAPAASAPENQVQAREQSHEIDAKLKETLLRRIARKELTVNAASDAYDVPQFMIYQWIAAEKELEAQKQAAQQEEERKKQEAIKAFDEAQNLADNMTPSERAAAAKQKEAEQRCEQMRVSGDRCIRAVALATTQTISLPNIAASFHMRLEALQECLKEAKAMGLLPWCLKMRKQDHDDANAYALLRQEMQEEQPEINFNRINAFRLAATDAVVTHGVAPKDAVHIFGISSYSSLYSWSGKAKKIGLKAWADSVGITESDFLWLGPQAK